MLYVLPGARDNLVVQLLQGCTCVARGECQERLLSCVCMVSGEGRRALKAIRLVHEGESLLDIARLRKAALDQRAQVRVGVLLPRIQHRRCGQAQLQVGTTGGLAERLRRGVEIEQIVYELERNTHVPPKRIRGIAHGRSAGTLVCRHRCKLIRPCPTTAQDRG